MTQWIRWNEFMQAWEATQFCEAMVISSQDLDLLAWIQEERQGRLVYRTDIHMREVTVWRETKTGQLAWDAINFKWIAESQIDQLYEYLKGQGFTGTRTDETTQGRHLVIFQQRRQRMTIRASQQTYQTQEELAGIAESFMNECRFRKRRLTSTRLR